MRFYYPELQKLSIVYSRISGYYCKGEISAAGFQFSTAAFPCLCTMVYDMKCCVIIASVRTFCAYLLQKIV